MLKSTPKVNGGGKRQAQQDTTKRPATTTPCFIFSFIKTKTNNGLESSSENQKGEGGVVTPRCVTGCVVSRCVRSILFWRCNPATLSDLDLWPKPCLYDLDIFSRRPPFRECEPLPIPVPVPNF